MNTVLAQASKNVNKALSFVITGFFFIFPLYFLPLTFDIVELNKSLILIVFTVLLLFVVIYRTFISKTFVLNVNYVTLPLFALFVGFTFSLAFSLSVSYSLWGFYGSLSNSYPVIISLILLAFVLPTLIEEKGIVSKSLKFLTYSLSIGLLLTLLSYFGVFNFTQGSIFSFLSNPLFTVLGPIGVLRIVTLLVTLFSTYFYARSKNMTNSVVYIVSLTLSLIVASLYLNIVYLVLNILVLGVSYYLFGDLKNKQILSYLVAPLLIAISLYLASTNADIAKNFNLRTERVNLNTISWNTSWSVANRVLGQRPFFGTGVSTYIHAYSVARPLSVNTTPYWDTRFIKPSSMYLLLLTEGGLLTFGAFVYLLLVFVAKSVKSFNKQFVSEHSLVSVLRLSILVLFLTYFVTSGSALSLGLFFLLLSLLLAAEKVENVNSVENKTIGISTKSSKEDTSISSLTVGGSTSVSLYTAVIVLFAVVSALLSYFTYVVQAADVAFKSPFNLPTNLIQLGQNYSRAVSINPRNDFYIRSAIDVNKRLAQALLIVPAEQEEQLTEEDKATRITDARNLITLTNRYSNALISGDLNINPLNWETRGLFMQFLIGVDDNAPLNAIQAYNQSLALDPNNARLVATVGTVYYQTGNYDLAAQYFERAVVLKVDYAAARYNLAKALEQLQRYPDAYAISTTVLNLLDPNSQDYKVASEYSEQLKALAQEQEEQANAEQDQNLQLDENQNTGDQAPLTEPDEPLQPNPEETSNTAVPQPTPSVTPSPTPTATVTPTPSPSPTEGGTGNNLPNQQPAEQGGGFIENNQN